MTDALGVTLLVSLVAALVFGSIAQHLRLSPLIGYIVAGLAVGPFTPGIVADREQVLGLADIGVALLMFSIGLRFSIGQIAALGRFVTMGAVVQVCAMIGIGYLLASLLGWPWLEALFIGAIVSNSSSVVLVKVAGEPVVQGTLHGRMALAWSAIQDIMTVGLVVVLTALAGRGDNPVWDALGSTGLALGFIGVVVILGSRLFPLVLGFVARIGSREIFVIAVAVLAIGAAFAATAVGISVALGAFIAGIALADSDLTDSVLGEIVPLRELFAAFFFVSIGLLLDPMSVINGAAIVAVLLVLIIPVKGLLTAGVAFAGGHSVRPALLTGGLIAQNGEFSFVLAVLALDLAVMSGQTFSLVMGAVVLSIVLANPVFALSARIAAWIPERRADDLQLDVAAAPGMRRHALVLGYGRVGRAVARVLTARGFQFMAIDVDFRLVQRAREENTPILFGEAGSQVLLDAAGIERAAVMVVAIPDPLAARQAVDYARSRNPRIDIVARAPSEGEGQYLRRRGADRVVVPEREIANELVRHTLHRFGVSEREIAAILQRRRE
jgi:monovalent cation:H+ antiporter-2, CPA2 family